MSQPSKTYLQEICWCYVSWSYVPLAQRFPELMSQLTLSKIKIGTNTRWSYAPEVMSAHHVGPAGLPTVYFSTGNWQLDHRVSRVGTIPTLFQNGCPIRKKLWELNSSDPGNPGSNKTGVIIVIPVLAPTSISARVSIILNILGSHSFLRSRLVPTFEFESNREFTEFK